ncbi:unnamed protein product [Linum trigynum]|uniref:Uncharacterized protein n=1 Tax=Linum trigynum TaxID=586398 RepID=A0AAV2CDQ4_9ROSI
MMAGLEELLAKLELCAARHRATHNQPESTSKDSSASATIEDAPAIVEFAPASVEISSIDAASQLDPQPTIIDAASSPPVAKITAVPTQPALEDEGPYAEIEDEHQPRTPTIILDSASPFNTKDEPSPKPQRSKSVVTIIPTALVSMQMTHISTTAALIAELENRAEKLAELLPLIDNDLGVETTTVISSSKTNPPATRAAAAPPWTLEPKEEVKEKGGDFSSSRAIREPSGGIRSPIAMGEEASRAAPVAATKAKRAEPGNDEPETRIRLLAASAAPTNGEERKMMEMSGWPPDRRTGGFPPRKDDYEEEVKSWLKKIAGFGSPFNHWEDHWLPKKEAAPEMEKTTDATGFGERLKMISVVASLVVTKGEMMDSIGPSC